MNDLVMFDSNAQNQNLPAHLRGANLGVNAGLLATVGAGGNRIGLRGSRFRIIVSGQEEVIVPETHLDVIIVGVVPHISRQYYEKAYNKDEKAAPTCFSVDGISPPLDLPTRQSDKCDTCKWNVKGSKVVDGNKTKACSYFQRIAVRLAGDDSDNYYSLNVMALGLFGDSIKEQNLYNIRDYAKVLANRGVDAAAIVTRLSFDTDASVPKLYFTPFRFITEEEYEYVSKGVNSEEVKQLLKIDVHSTDISNERSLPEEEAEQEVAQEAEQEVAQEGTGPVEMDATPEPEPEPEQPAQKRKYKMTEKADGLTYEDFVAEGWDLQGLLDEGYIMDVTPKPVPPKPAAPKPKPVPPKPAAPKPAAKATAPAPGVRKGVPVPGKAESAPAQTAPAPKPTKAAVVETSTSDELDDILKDLV